MVLISEHFPRNLRTRDNYLQNQPLPAYIRGCKLEQAPLPSKTLEPTFNLISSVSSVVLDAENFQQKSQEIDDNIKYVNAVINRVKRVFTSLSSISINSEDYNQIVDSVISNEPLIPLPKSMSESISQSVDMDSNTKYEEPVNVITFNEVPELEIEPSQSETPKSSIKSAKSVLRIEEKIRNIGILSINQSKFNTTNDMLSSPKKGIKIKGNSDVASKQKKPQTKIPIATDKKRKSYAGNFIAVPVSFVQL